jgi:hypothetical protein
LDGLWYDIDVAGLLPVNDDVREALRDRLDATVSDYASQRKRKVVFMMDGGTFRSLAGLLAWAMKGLVVWGAWEPPPWGGKSRRSARRASKKHCVTHWR